MEKLPNDIARCHDEKCQVKEGCERWLQRENVGSGAVHAMTLRPSWQCFDELCDHALTSQELDDV